MRTGLVQPLLTSRAIETDFVENEIGATGNDFFKIKDFSQTSDAFLGHAICCPAKNRKHFFVKDADRKKLVKSKVAIKLGGHSRPKWGVNPNLSVLGQDAYPLKALSMGH